MLSYALGTSVNFVSVNPNRLPPKINDQWLITGVFTEHGEVRYEINSFGNNWTHSDLDQIAEATPESLATVIAIENVASDLYDSDVYPSDDLSTHFDPMIMKHLVDVLIPKAIAWYVLQSAPKSVFVHMGDETEGA